MKRFIYAMLSIIITIIVSACARAAAPSDTAVANVFTSTPPVRASTPIATAVNDTAQFFSSAELGLCFSYPQGYTQLPYNDTVQISAPNLPGTDTQGLFWLERSDAYNRTAEKIADQDMTAAGLSSVGRSFITMDGEPAVVLDGMPGQDLQRRVYVVHGQTLYVLAFMPTRSANKAAGDQTEALYQTVTNSWAWSPCSASK